MFGVGTGPVVIPAAKNRLYVTNPLDWAYAVGTDYIFNPSTMTDLNTSGTAGTLLSGRGWVTTSLGFQTATGADFLSAADPGTPNGILTNAASDLIQSPAVFGDYAHALAVSWILGYMPTELNLEWFSQFSVASANETASCLGFVEAGGSIVTANDALATVFSDGTNFKGRSGAATTAAMAVIDTNWSLWRIRILPGGITVYRDGVIQNATPLALETDLFPCSIGMGVVAAGTNRLQGGPIHVYYR